MACYIIIHLWICIHNKQVTNNKIYTNCQSCLLPRGSIIMSHQQGYKTALTMCTVFEQNKILITARHPYPFSTSFHAFTVLCNNIKQLIVFTKMYIKLYEISSTLPWKPGRCHNMLNLPFFQMSRLMTKRTMWLCARRRLMSAWASAQSDQRLRCPHEESLGP